MKPITISLLFFGLLSCTNRSAENPAAHSRVQMKLSGLKKMYASEYEQAATNADQKQIKDKYQDLVNTYLLDSCKGILDSMSVRVESVEAIATSVLTAQFKDESSKYKLTQKWDGAEAMKNDSVYQRLLRLRRSGDTTLNFRYAGACSVNPPGSSKGAFEIAVAEVIKRKN